MKKVLASLFIAALVGIHPCAAQQQKESSDLTKEQKKALRRQERDLDIDKIEAMLASRQWVLEAHTVQDRYGNSFHLDPTINFVAVNGNTGAVQLGFNGLVGWNGVGGITVEGPVTKYEMKAPGKNRSPRVFLRFQGRGVGWASITLNVNATYQATARLVGDFGDRITFQGRLVPLEESTVYQGQSLF